jgi:hypothetical protein
MYVCLRLHIVLVSLPIDFYRSFGDAVGVVGLPIGCLPAEIHTVAVIESQVRPWHCGVAKHEPILSFRRLSVS